MSTYQIPVVFVLDLDSDSDFSLELAQ